MQQTPALRALFSLPALGRGWWGAFAVLLALSLALRVVAMVNVPLVPEEAYYWMYAQHPNLSYYDHPPMVAWVIGLGTVVFGHNEFGVRIVSSLLMIGASVLMYAFGRMWFSRSAALLAAVLLQLLPLYFAVGFIATMDGALLFFWMLCLVGVSVALREDRAWGWYVAGLALGAAMLSKYTGVFLGAGTLLAVVVHRPWRHHLRSVHPYLAVLLALAAFSPVVIWNAQHHWDSFRFQFVDRYARESFSPAHFLTFVAYQFAVVTPLLLIGCGYLVWRVLRRSGRLLPARWLIALCFSVPLLAATAYKAIRYDIHINWTLPLFLSLFPAIAQCLLVRVRWLRTAADRQRCVSGFARTAIICAAINFGLMAYLLTLQPRLQLISAFGPWPQLARIVEDHEDQMVHDPGREPLIVADGKYRLASVLAFYRRPIEHDVDTSEYTTSQWIFGGSGLGFPYWTQRERWTGNDCIYVIDDGDDKSFSEIKPLFASVESVQDPRLDQLGRKKGQYRIAICKALRQLPTAPQPPLAHAGARYAAGPGRSDAHR